MASYNQVVKMQDARAKVNGLAVMARTFFAILFGMWSHIVHATELRFNMLPILAQHVFNLHSFILLDLLIMFIAR